MPFNLFQKLAGQHPKVHDNNSLSVIFLTTLTHPHFLQTPPQFFLAIKASNGFIKGMAREMKSAVVNVWEGEIACKTSIVLLQK